MAVHGDRCHSAKKKIGEKRQSLIAQQKEIKISSTLVVWY